MQQSVQGPFGSARVKHTELLASTFDLIIGVHGLYSDATIL